MYQDQDMPEAKSQGGDLDFEEIDHVLQDFGAGEQKQQATQHDALIFVIQCSEQIFKPLPGHDRAQFEYVLDSFINTLKNKIISSPSDKAGLILYNVQPQSNELRFASIANVIKIDTIRADTIRLAKKLLQQYNTNYQISKSPAKFHEILWLFNQQTKSLEKDKYQLRMFLFTAEEVPPFQNDQDQEMAVNHAIKLVNQGMILELFPLKKGRLDVFDVRKFYQNIITIDPDQLNMTALDSTAKIMELQKRLRQKLYKKRTLSKLTLQLDQFTILGVKIYCTFSKSKKPIAKKLDARSNKPLKRLTKFVCRQTGDTLYQNQINTFFPLGGEKVLISKKDIEKIKSLQQPGIKLIGFKERTTLKSKLNFRTSYFMYPDEDRVAGSSFFFDALIKQMSKRQKIAIVKFVPRKGMAVKICALVPQLESYDQDHFQIPPGLHVVFLPFAEDVAKPKIEMKQEQFSQELLSLTKLLVNNLTLQDYSPRNFQNPSLQKFYSHLQAHALNQFYVEEFQDLLQPDADAFFQAQQIMQLINQTLKMQSGNCKSQKKGKKQSKEVQKKAHSNKKQKQIKMQTEWDWLEEGVLAKDYGKIKVADLKEYLGEKYLSTSGNKAALIERVEKLLNL